MPGEDCLLHFPWWKIHLGDVVTKHSLFPGIVPDIAQKEGSGGPRPVASWSHCVYGQYLTSYAGYKTGARNSQNASVKGSGRVPKSVHSPVILSTKKRIDIGVACTTIYL